MTERTPPATATPAGDLTDDAFVPDLVSDLSRGGYSRSAWGRFWRRAWQRAWCNIGARPRRRVSTLRWIAVGAVVGTATLAVGYGPARALGLVSASLTWGSWFAATSFWVYLHQGLIRSEEGAPFDRFLWPNGLSYLRLALCPLVVDPVLSVSAQGAQSVVLLAVLILLVLTDQLDGLLARGLRQQSRLGRLLDPMADLAFLCWLAAGLHRAGVLPALTLWAVVLRYPGALVGGIVLSFAKGPSRTPVTATWIGKVTTWGTSFVLVLGAAVVRLWPESVGAAWLVVLMDLVTVLLAGNLAYLCWRAMVWARAPS